MIKPFIALAFFCKLHDNRNGIRYTAKHRRALEAMIRNSNNAATNRIMKLVSPSPKGVERILKLHAPGIFQNTAIVERIPRNGRSYRNKASARDYSRFLYALWHDQFPYSHELKELMHLSNKDRIYYGAERVARATEVYDKTGTTARLCGNMGILVAQGKDGRRYPYTFVGIIEKGHRARRFGAWSATRGNVIREVSNIVYSDLKRIHNLV
jgi:beta-lactamase class A